MFDEKDTVTKCQQHKRKWNQFINLSWFNQQLVREQSETDNEQLSKNKKATYVFAWVLSFHYIERNKL